MMLPSSSWFALPIIYLFVLLFGSDIWRHPSPSVKALSPLSWSSWAGLKVDDCSLHVVLASDSVACLVPKVSLLDLYPICLPLKPVLQCYDGSVLPSTCKSLSVLSTTRKSVSVLSTTLKSVPVSALELASFSVDSVDLSLTFAQLDIVESGFERPFETCSLVNILLEDDRGLLHENLNPLYMFMMKLFDFHWPCHMLSLRGFMVFCCLIRPMTVKHICRSIKCRLMQGFLHAHDFRALWSKLCTTCYLTMIFLLLGHLHLHVNVKSEPHTPLQPEDKIYNLQISEIGGGRVPTFSFGELLPYLSVSDQMFDKSSVFKFVTHSHNRVAHVLYDSLSDHICVAIPLEKFAAKCTMKDFKLIAGIHSIPVLARAKTVDIPTLLHNHHCLSCESHVSVFVLHTVKSSAARSKDWNKNLDAKDKKQKVAREKKNKETQKTK